MEKHGYKGVNRSYQVNIEVKYVFFLAKKVIIYGFFLGELFF